MEPRLTVDFVSFPSVIIPENNFINSNFPIYFLFPSKNSTLPWLAFALPGRWRDYSRTDHDPRDHSLPFASLRRVPALSAPLSETPNPWTGMFPQFLSECIAFCVLAGKVCKLPILIKGWIFCTMLHLVEIEFLTLLFSELALLSPIFLVEESSRLFGFLSQANSAMGCTQARTHGQHSRQQGYQPIQAGKRLAKFLGSFSLPKS